MRERIRDFGDWTSVSLLSTVEQVVETSEEAANTVDDQESANVADTVEEAPS
jgi:hypothetical protein